MSGKESTIIILSNTNSMQKKYSDSNLTRLDFGKDSIVQLIRQKLIFSVKKDEIGIILTTENEAGNFFLPLTNYSPDLLEQTEKIKIENENFGDIFESIEIAIEKFINKYKKLKWNKKIFLITDGESNSNFDEEKIEFLAEKIDKNEIKINIICIDFFNELDDDDENVNMNNETKNQMKTKKLLKFLENKTKNIKIFTSNQANYIYHQFKKKKINPVTKFRGPLIISPELSIDVMIYTKTTQTNIPSLKKYSKVTPFNEDPNTGNVINERVYYIHDDPEKTPIEKEFMAKAYYYGNSLVPVAKTDEIRFKNTEQKCLKTIGFTDSFRIPRHYFLSGVDVLIPNPSSSEDILALQSLVTEMLKLNKVLIARYVYRQNSEPKLVILTPHQSKRGPVFYINVLPTVEDIRDFQFSSLDSCTIQQEEIVGKFIDSLDLEKNGEEILKPNETFNPVLQYFYQCLESKFLDKNEDFPALDEAIANYLIPNKKLFENNKYASFLHKMFKIKEKDKIEDKKKRIFWKEIIQNELNTTITQQRIEEKLNAKKTEDKTTISAITPIEDFKEMIGNKKVDYTVKAMNLMIEMIINFIRDSFKGSYFIKAIECIKTLRQTAIEEDEVDLFNDFLNEIKKLFPKEKFSDFWSLFCDNKITLISEDENEKSKFSEKQAQNWIDEIKGKEVITSTLQEMDNLLEDID